VIQHFCRRGSDFTLTEQLAICGAVLFVLALGFWALWTTRGRR
jgi:hypothetical protein